VVLLSSLGERRNFNAWRSAIEAKWREEGTKTRNEPDRADGPDFLLFFERAI